MQKPSIKSVVLSALAGWTALLAAEAIYTFVIPHGPNFAPEIGPLASFIVFSALFSCYYAVAFVLIIMPVWLYFRALFERIVLWQRACLGAFLFAGCAAALAPTVLGFRRADTLYLVILASIGGFASFAALPHSNKT